jgi:Ca2+-binding RTX toxin-like protein
VALFVVACALATAPAHAATVSSVTLTVPTGPPSCMGCMGRMEFVTFEAAPGERNDVHVTSDSAGAVVSDAGAAIAAGPGCNKTGPATVACSSPNRGPFVEVLLGDGADRATSDQQIYDLSSRRAPITIFGGDGDDALTGSDDADILDLLDGGDGDDRIDGRAGRDLLWGRNGDDVLVGGDSEDVIDGGDGDDRVEARDARRDRIDCGAGTDTAIADELDLREDNCELASDPPAPAAPLVAEVPAPAFGPSAPANPGRARPLGSSGPRSADHRAPRLSRLTAHSGRRITLRYVLSERATVTFVLRRRVGRGRHARFVTLRGALTHTGAAGRHTFVFSGRLHGHALARGHYRIVAVARDDAGNRSRGATASVAVTR